MITVAFVQFSGTDELLVRTGPDALADALDEVVRNVQRACADHDVTFFETDINRDGGKIMLTAGAPRSADHDEERMLRVARRRARPRRRRCRCGSASTGARSSPATSAPRSGVPTRSRATPSTSRPA